jgi:hypothetical protein
MYYARAQVILLSHMLNARYVAGSSLQLSLRYDANFPICLDKQDQSRDDRDKKDPGEKPGSSSLGGALRQKINVGR